MPRKSHDDALGMAGAETIIGTGVSVQGQLASDADIIIDGTLKGDIKTNGDLTIGVNASITADVQAVNVVIAGNLIGNITASGEATIRETGQVKGDIQCSSLSIVPGGIFLGRSLMELSTQLDNKDQN